LPRVLIIAQENEPVKRMCSALKQHGFTCLLVSHPGDVFKKVAEFAPDLLLITLNGHLPNAEAIELARRLKLEKRLPVIALVTRKTLFSEELSPDIDDFVVELHDLDELLFRVKRVIQKSRQAESPEVIKHGDLVIDTARCEVTIKGVPIELTFKEYELLKYLASHKGRVFSRESLLNKVWGYDYYGGDRTVDVHIRRLRSKIESASNQTYIETVRNIGYRFKARA